ncbi:hypothetical protein [Lysobacter capsici]|uniref:hypothetical protein n=1 Tax=Lysobacter capsici TaxID=435897 RepID=UPI00287BB4E7|nr:hypothetical protein [Lysobacter capsici]WND81952.1 hypothetical protein RJ610_06205 [Lysobacter capsici]WND87148.1 hypothetical protein RJ609_06210 [Lysobacter capsici]
MRACRFLDSGRRIAIVSVAMLSLSAAVNACADERYEGVAYAPDSKRVLYRETHWRYSQDGVGQRIVLYRCPRGEAFARKVVTDSPSASAPDFGFVDARDGYEEGVWTRQGRRHVYTRKDTAAARKETALPERAGAVIDAGFDAMIRLRWDALSAGKPIAAPFLLPSRGSFLDFRIEPLEQGNGAASVRRLRMALDTWYGFAIAPIELRYAVADRRLLTFQGISTIRDQAGRYQNVRIEFAAPTQADAAERQAARTQPLVKSCAGAGT